MSGMLILMVAAFLLVTASPVNGVSQNARRGPRTDFNDPAGFRSSRNAQKDKTAAHRKGSSRSIARRCPRSTTSRGGRLGSGQIGRRT